MFQLPVCPDTPSTAIVAERVRVSKFSTKKSYTCCASAVSEFTGVVLSPVVLSVRLTSGAGIWLGPVTSPAGMVRVYVAPRLGQFATMVNVLLTPITSALTMVPLSDMLIWLASSEAK